ncbi:LPD38 domain-containing protein [Taylorella asinigenitalis]|uniref:Putative phage protein n=1 Tax=Taylorella asinigenitalis (strain MCE3) TaxID=1008459 RepID=G4QCV7_TAYAM|nr:LPD38 domain-containing protein [Taylorella asinigenitalis]AEP36237.1 putative phage protein [Taylorella asinigenitalis MCE3]
MKNDYTLPYLDYKNPYLTNPQEEAFELKKQQLSQYKPDVWLKNNGFDNLSTKGRRDLYETYKSEVVQKVLSPQLGIPYEALLNDLETNINPALAEAMKPIKRTWGQADSDINTQIKMGIVTAADTLTTGAENVIEEAYNADRKELIYKLSPIGTIDSLFGGSLYERIKRNSSEPENKKKAPKKILFNKGANFPETMQELQNQLSAKTKDIQKTQQENIQKYGDTFSTTVKNFTLAPISTMSNAAGQLAPAAMAAFVTGPAAPAVLGGFGYLTNSGEAIQAVHDEIMNMPEEQLRKSPQWQQLESKGFTPQEIRYYLANTTEGREGLYALAGATGVVGGLFGAESLVGKPFIRPLAKSLFTVGEEVADSAIEVSGNTLAKNIPLQDFDPNRSNWEGFGSNFAGELIQGVPFAAPSVIGSALYSRSSPQKPKTPRDLTKEDGRKITRPVPHVPEEDNSSPYYDDINVDEVEVPIQDLEGLGEAILAQAQQDGNNVSEAEVSQIQEPAVPPAVESVPVESVPAESTQDTPNYLQRNPVDESIPSPVAIRPKRQVLFRDNDEALISAISEYVDASDDNANQWYKIYDTIKESRSLDKVAKGDDVLSAVVKKYKLNKRFVAPKGHKPKDNEVLETIEPIAPIEPKEPIEGNKINESIKDNQRVRIQNRDRTTKQSQAQVINISKNLDPDRVGISKTFADGSPIVEENPAINIKEAALGNRDIAVDGNGGKIGVQYAVVEANDLLPSHDFTGGTNKDYELGNDTQFRVLAGNGRAAGIQLAYKNKQTQNYSTGIQNQLSSVGIDPKAWSEFKNPVLVRITSKENVTADFGDRSNVSSAAALSSYEQAVNDSHRSDLDYVDFDANGEPTAESVNKFVQTMPVSERVGLYDSNSKLSRQSYDRLKNALFYKAFKDEDLLNIFSTQADPEITNIFKAMSMASKEIQALEGAGDLDFRGYLTNAMRVLVNSKRENIPLKDAHKQSELDDSQKDDSELESRFVSMLGVDGRAYKKLGNKIKALAQKAIDENDRPSEDMFGETPPKKTLHELLDEVENDELLQSKGIGKDVEKGKLKELLKNYEPKYRNAVVTPVRSSGKNFAELKQIAKDNFVGKDLVNNNDSRIAVVSNTNIDKMVSGKAVNKSSSPNEHMLSVSNLDALYENSLRGWSKLDRSNDVNIKNIHRYFTILPYEDKLRLVKLTLKEIKEGNRPDSLYTVEAVDTNEKSSAVSWVTTEIEKEFQGLERPPHTEDVNILAKIVDDFNSDKEKYNTQYKLIRDAVDRATGKHKDKVNLISRADFARVLANRGKSADYIETNYDTVNAYFDTASKEINVVYNKSNMTPELAAFAAWHELGHYGFRLPRSQEYKVVLDTASKHPLIKELSKKMRDNYANDNVILSDEKAIEEAIVEIFAASQTGDFDHLANQWNLNISPELRGNKDTVFNRIINKIKEILNAVLGTKLTDKGLLEILSSLRQDLDSIDVNDSDIVVDDTRYSKKSNKSSSDKTANDDLFDFGFQDSRKVLDFKKLKKNLSKESIEQLDKIDKLRNDNEYEISGNKEVLDYIKQTDLTKEIIDILVKFGDENVRLKMIDQKNISDKSLEKLANDMDFKVRENVAAHDNTSIETLKKLATDKNSYVRENVLNNPNINSKILNILASDPEKIIRKKVLNNLLTSKDILDKLADDEYDEIRIKVAGGFLTSKNTLDKLADDENLDVIKNVSLNANTPSTALEKISNHNDVVIRKRVARHHNTSETTLDKLAENKNSDVRFEVAKNFNTNTETLDKLAKDDNVDIRVQVAKHKKTSPNTLAILADDEGDVRIEVARNSNANNDTLKKLAKDINGIIREALAESQQKLDGDILRILSKDKSDFVRQRVAQHSSTPVDVLEELSHDIDAYVRENVARNINTSLSVLKELSNDKHAMVRKEVSKNSNIPADILEQLSKDKNKPVRENVARNINTPATALKELSNDKHVNVREAVAQNSTTPIDILKKLSKDSEHSVQFKVAVNPNTPVETLRELSNRKNLGIKLRVARNKNTPLDVLEKFFNSDNINLNEVASFNITLPNKYFRDDIKFSLDAINNGREDKELAEHILKELQKNENYDYEALNILIRSGLIDINSIRDVGIKTVMRKRKELKDATKAVEAGVFKFEDVFKASNIPNKDRFIGDLSQTFGKEVVNNWRAKNLIEPEVWLSVMDSSPYMMTRPLKRESIMQTIGGYDYAINFFHERGEDIPKIRDFYMKIAQTPHPSGFGFVLFRDFDNNGEKSAVITEVQSDLMSVLYSNDKTEIAHHVFGDDLEAVKQYLKPEQKTYPRVLARNTIRQLFNSGYKKIYALTPDGIKKLGASPPESVVKEWHDDFDLENETIVKIDGKKIFVSAPIDVDSDFAQGVLFSKSPNKDRNYQRVIRNTSDSTNANDDAQFSKDSVNDIRERPKAKYKPNLIQKAKEIDYKTAKDTIKYVFAGGDTVQPEWSEKITTLFFDSKAPFSNLLKSLKGEDTKNLERIFRTYEAAASQESSDMIKNFYEPLQDKLQGLWKEKYKEIYSDNGGWRQFLEDFSTVGNLILHGKERNKEILRKTKGKDKAGSGATDEEINAWATEINRIAPDLIDDYKDIYSSIIKPMLEYKDNLLLEAGLLTQEMIDARPKYEYYVPLYGDPAEEAIFNVGDLEGSEKVKLRDITDLNAKGRSGTLADNVIQNILTTTQNAINRSGQQVFKRELFKVVENNKGLKELMGAKLNTVDFQDAYKKKLGKDGYVYYLPDNSVFTDKKVNSKDRMFADKNAIVLRDGRDVKILRIGDAKVAESIQQVNLKDTGLLDTVFGRLTKRVGSLFTIYNPVFGPLNKIRDMQSQFSLVLANGDIPLNKAVQIIRKAFINNVAFMADRNTDPNSKYQQRKREYEKLGGVTFYSKLFGKNKIDTAADEFARAIGASTKHEIAKGIKTLSNFFDEFNNHLEMTSRVAIFDAIIESGVMNKEDAALWVKNTMNFETKGKLGDSLGALWYFANPQLFDARRVLQSLRTPRGAATLVALTAMDMAIRSMLIAMGGVDDDGEYRYFKVPQTITGNFWTLIEDNDGNGWRVPVGFGFGRIASNIADSLLRYQYGVADESTTIANIAKNAFFSNLSPVQPVDIDPSKDFAGWALQSFMPSLVKPMVQLATNKNGLGGNIHKPSEWVGEKMHFTQSYPKTDLLWQDLAKGVYEYTGIDAYPEVYRFLVQNYLGSGAMELIRGLQILSGEKGSPLLKEIPLVQGFRNKSYSQDSTTFFNNKRAVDSLVAKKNYAIENGNLLEFNRENPNVELLKQLYKSANKELRELQSKRKQILADRSDLELRRQRALEVDREMRHIYQMTNKLYKDLTDPANKLGF